MCFILIIVLLLLTACSTLGDNMKLTDNAASEGEKRIYSVHYQGKNYTECIRMCDDVGVTGYYEEGRHDSSGAIVIHSALRRTMTFSWRTPKGYDGFILGFMDASIDHRIGQYLYEYIDENTLLFQFKNPNNSNK